MSTSLPPAAPAGAPAPISSLERTLAGLIVLGVLAAAGLWYSVRINESDLRGAQRGLEEARASLRRAEESAGIYGDTTKAAIAASEKSVPDTQPYIVVSIAENRLWYKLGDSVLFTTRVATGTGKTLKRPGGREYRFETPRGRLKVEKKEVEPAWVPPDWHYLEFAKKKKTRTVKLDAKKELRLGDGSVIAVVGQDVVKRLPTGELVPYAVKEGHEIMATGESSFRHSARTSGSTLVCSAPSGSTWATATASMGPTCRRRSARRRAMAACASGTKTSRRCTRW